MSTLNVEAFQASVASRAAELIAVTKAGRKDNACREARFIVTSELRQVSDVLALEALKSANLSPAELGTLLPEVYSAKIANSSGERSLGEITQSAFLISLSDRGLQAAKPLMYEQTASVTLAEIVNVLQKGYSRVAKRHHAFDVYGRISLYAEMFIEKPDFETFKDLIGEAAYLAGGLEQEHSNLYERNPHRKTAFADISRAVFEMQSIGKDICDDEERFNRMVQDFIADIENDKVDIYVNDGVSRLS